MERRLLVGVGDDRARVQRDGGCASEVPGVTTWRARVTLSGILVLVLVLRAPAARARARL